MKSYRSKFCGAGVATFLAGLAPAHAQSFNLERLPTTPDSRDGFATSRLHPNTAGRWGIAVVADYAADPLVVALQRPAGAESEIVGSYLAAHLNGSFALDSQVALFAGVDVPMVISGANDPGLGAIATQPNGGGIGDAWVGSRALLWRGYSDQLSLGVQGALGLPAAKLSDAPAYRGENSVSFVPQALADLRLPDVRLSGNLGFAFRQSAATRSATVGNELRYALAVALPAGDSGEVLGEAFGAVPLVDFGDPQGMHLECLVGFKVRLLEQFTTGMALGTGITEGVGTPTFRGFLTLGYRVEDSASPYLARASQ